MVYSSDFYTSRRPAYYKPASSYSVTPLYSSDGYDLPPTYYKAHQVYQTSTTPTPFILTPSISTGKPSTKVLPYNGYPYNHHHYVPLHRRSAATIHGVLDRIEHRPRSHPSYDATDEYLNSRSSTNFDDVTRDIRAQTAGLLKQVYTPSIRPKISSVSNGYSELPVSQRIESDAYIEKILSDSDSYRRENNIGKGHLACVSYAGGKAYPRRRPHLSKEVDDNITMLSYYNKTREAVAASSTNPTVKINNTESPKYCPKKKLEDDSKNNFDKNLAADKKATQLGLEKETAEKKAAQLHAEEEAAKKDATRLAAKEAARLAAEEEAAEEKAAKEEATRLAAEEEAAHLAAEEEKARLAAEEEAARLAAEKEAARLAAEEEAARSALDQKVEEAEETQQLVNETTTEEEIDQSEQKIKLSEKTIDISSESQETNDAAIAKSSTTTTSTEIINEDEGGVKTTAVFQRTIKKTTTITSSTSVVSENDDDINSKVEIQEIVEENGDSGEDEHDTEHLDAAQAEGQESSEEEDESEEEEESEEE
ncbi:uncharacterized protein CG45076-like isoform X1 [Myzus persicae]|uniref:uncharacterized protein CG45076-like isoform X1 n=1 Tax=Myzus persicae TaxID=13164 RepID=UPI000B9312A3|nr:uncharacterized protein CG45076-like isoform X1 [Myzus persicae]